MRVLAHSTLSLAIMLIVAIWACVRVLAPTHLVEMDPTGYSPQAPANDGLPTISDTFNPRDQGTDWPLDAFGSRVVGHISPRSIATPARHSYDGDGNMEALSAFGPYAHQEDRTSLGTYTGAVGPAGGSTPEAHPEITAP